MSQYLSTHSDSFHYAIQTPIAPPPPIALTQSVLGRRIAAGLIDLVPALVVGVALGTKSSSGSGQFSVEVANAKFLLSVVVWLAYSFVSEAATGTTFGKRLFGLVVVDPHGRKPTISAITVRTLMRLVDGLPFFYLLGVIACASNPNHQRFGDRAAKTRVVRAGVGVSPAATSTRASITVIGLAATTAAAGLIGLATGGGFTTTGVEATSIESYHYQTEIMPFVDQVMVAAFAEPSLEAMRALTVSEIPDNEIQDVLIAVDQAAGPLVGDYRIDNYTTTTALRLDNLTGVTSTGRAEITAPFENGIGQIVIVIAPVEGRLQVISWSVR